MANLMVHVPEPGQLVDVRQRRYVVVDVVQGTVPAEASGKLSLHLQTQSQHLVALNSVEDDIWAKSCR